MRAQHQVRQDQVVVNYLTVDQLSCSTGQRDPAIGSMAHPASVARRCWGDPLIPNVR